ncbi:unnamed protein product [Polarella glacialis]|uniref:Uncharacterized protein n=1 Tax=Polarella glacialis TaxID=89957 RepID=A0A813EB84_POLGL|nr:unnamed protein product [Polarella glacialis]
MGVNVVEIQDKQGSPGRVSVRQSRLIEDSTSISFSTSLPQGVKEDEAARRLVSVDFLNSLKAAALRTVPGAVAITVEFYPQVSMKLVSSSEDVVEQMPFLQEAWKQSGRILPWFLLATCVAALVILGIFGHLFLCEDAKGRHHSDASSSGEGDSSEEGYSESSPKSLIEQRQSQREILLTLFAPR